MFTAQWEALPAKKRIREGRRLVLVDIENAAGTPDPAPGDVHRVFADLVALQGAGTRGEQIVLAASHHAMEVAAFAWPGDCRKVMRSGPDGADLALLAVLEEHVEDRFAQVVLVSGDGIFTPAVRHLVTQGLSVTVAARPESLAATLRLCATSVFELPNIHPTTSRMAA